MACISCNKTVNDNINFTENNRVTVGDVVRVKSFVYNWYDSPFYVPSDNNERYTSDDNFDGLSLPSVCYTNSYANHAFNINSYYSEHGGIYKFDFPYYIALSGRQSGMLKHSTRPETSSYIYARNPRISIQHIGLNTGSYSHHYAWCAFYPDQYIARFPNIVYTDSDYKLRTDIRSDVTDPVLYLPYLDGGLLFGIVNSSLTKSWWVYLETGHRRCRFVSCTPQIAGTKITPHNYNQEDAYCGFYGYLFELSRDELSNCLEQDFTYNTTTRNFRIHYAHLGLNLTSLPDNRFVKFRLWYNIRKRTTCHPDDSYSFFHTNNMGSINLYCGLIISTLSDLVEFNFNPVTNNVEFKYGNRFTYTYPTPHDNQYVIWLMGSFYNTRYPPASGCNPYFPEGTRPVRLYDFTESAGRLIMESSYPFIYGENPFINFPRVIIES